MSFLSSNVVAGLPAFIGVILGLRLAVEGCTLLFYVGALLVAAVLALNLGYSLMSRFPRVAGWLIEIWILSAIAVTACATAAVIAISFRGLLDKVVGIDQLSGERAKTVSTALIGAVTTYVALAWTKDIGDAKGYFWPSTHFKNAMQDAYDALVNKPGNDSQVFEAMFSDNVRDHGDIGWDFAARRIRSRILSEFIQP
jgi:hypothetical protein